MRRFLSYRAYLGFWRGRDISTFTILWFIPWLCVSKDQVTGLGEGLMWAFDMKGLRLEHSG